MPKLEEHNLVMGASHPEWEYNNGLEADKKKEPDQAMNWFIKSAAHGYKPAQEHIDKICAGYIKKGDLTSAERIYRKIEGLAEGAMKNVYREKRFAMYYKAASEDNDANAQFIIGKMYEDGDVGGKKNIAKANHWYQRAAHQNNQQAIAAISRFRASSTYKTELAKEVGFDRYMPLITTKLSDNIMKRSGNKLSDKVKLLIGLTSLLKSPESKSPESNLDLKDPDTQAVITALCQQICKMKRHSLDPSKPKSVKEFTEELDNLELKVDSNIHFSKKELNDLKALLTNPNPNTLSSKMTDLIKEKVGQIKNQRAAPASPG